MGYTSIVFDDNTPYLAYWDNSQGHKATVEEYDGTDWVTVGVAGFSSGIAPYLSLALDNGIPYVAYRDGGNNDRAIVMRFADVPSVDDTATTTSPNVY
ncbi:MAG: hypothetical protein WDN27_04565 [Candidatus Saccharibacteria bacterium]